MTDERHEELFELAALYALDALEPAERERFEEHLTTCTECRREVASFQETASHLVEDDVPPPPQMREDLLAEIDSIDQEAPEEPSAPATSAPEAPAVEAEAAAGEETAPVTPIRPRRRRGRIIGGLAGVAVAASALVFAAVERPWESDETPAPPEQQVIAAEDAQRFEGESAEDGLAVIHSPSQGQAVLEVGELEQPPDGHTYQAWYLHEDAEPVSAGVLPAEADREDATLLEGDPGGATGVALTVEPEGGSQQPTTDPTYVVELS